MGGALADADPEMLQADTFELVCQVNGKVRDRVTASTGAPREELEQLCLAARGVQSHVDGQEVAKVIVVPDKLVNFVIRSHVRRGSVRGGGGSRRAVRGAGAGGGGRWGASWLGRGRSSSTAAAAG